MTTEDLESSSPLHPAPATSCAYDFIMALDLESTCDENHSNPTDIKVPRDQGEIIEMSFAVVNVATKQIVLQTQIFVKPENTPLTPFCTNLTGITAAHLETAGSLQSAITAIDTFIQTNFTSQSKTFGFMTHGEWDLRYQLNRESREKGIHLAPHYNVFFDAVAEVNRYLVLINQKSQSPKASLIGLCHAMGLQHEGRLHSGIDDANTVARICVAVLDGVEKWVASGEKVKAGKVVPMTTPVNLSQQLSEFYETMSTILHFGGLPFKATQSDMEAWITLAGVKAIDLWMVRNAEGRADGTGFAVFANHEDAKQCLSLDGRILGERTIQVSPASDKSLEATVDVRARFPTAEEIAAQYPAPEMLPGDWLCTACQYHNFASRRNCLKCAAVSPIVANAGHVQTQMVGSGTMNHSQYSYSQSQGQPPKNGDWVCQNAACKFQNFASRHECLRCRTRKPFQHVQMPYIGVPGVTISTAAAANIKSNVSGKVLPGDWACTSCSLNNFASRSRCWQCGTLSPAQAASGPLVIPPGGPRSRPTDRPGDWNCSNSTCRYHNYASRTECYRCGNKKVEVGVVNHASNGGNGMTMQPMHYHPPVHRYQPPHQHMQMVAAIGVTPQMILPIKAGDWICANPVCKYHNFAKRETCAMCGMHASISVGNTPAGMVQQNGNGAQGVVMHGAQGQQMVNVNGGVMQQHLQQQNLQQQIQQVQVQQQQQQHHQQQSVIPGVIPVSVQGNSQQQQQHQQQPQQGYALHPNQQSYYTGYGAVAGQPQHYESSLYATEYSTYNAYNNYYGHGNGGYATSNGQQQIPQQGYGNYQQ
ncbi:hypothetical protein HDU76_006572 [Blyttiomyces sp. JEL0837]|nr:hypothetical protein HDU76_006572 [Blyttiomyces sp. JEL0837]